MMKIGLESHMFSFRLLLLSEKGILGRTACMATLVYAYPRNQLQSSPEPISSEILYTSA